MKDLDDLSPGTELFQAVNGVILSTKTSVCMIYIQN